MAIFKDIKDVDYTQVREQDYMTDDEIREYQVGAYFHDADLLCGARPLTRDCNPVDGVRQESYHRTHPDAPHHRERHDHLCCEATLLPSCSRAFPVTPSPMKPSHPMERGGVRLC